MPVLAQGCPDPAAPYGSAYWGRPAAHTGAGEVVGAAKSDPKPSPRVIPPWALQQVVGYLEHTGRDANIVAEAALEPLRNSDPLRESLWPD